MESIQQSVFVNPKFRTATQAISLDFGELILNLRAAISCSKESEVYVAGANFEISLSRIRVET